MPEFRIIELVDELPCGALRGDKLCGRPTKVAHAISADSLPGYQRVGLTASEWILLPLCQDCTVAVASQYVGIFEEADR